ncbi:hypothetical protein [Reyranella sp.]|uniref:hypothetical protein n=1 Tax=Reyranella sp. TaxID=1929291 RepID=UPI0027313A3C|nr:hypothetical protein [Reyranella sp.]MDP2377674.1 hypothetical protein [Reyranella sp.]
MKKGVIAGLTAIALVGIGAAAVPVLQEYAAARIKAEIERDGTTTVGRVEVGLLGRRVALTDIKSSHAAGLSVGHWEASGLGWPLAELMRGRTPLAGFRWGEPLQADRVELKDVRAGNRGTGGTWKVDSLILEGLDLARFEVSDAGPYGPVVLVARTLSALSVRRLELHGAAIASPGSSDTFGMAIVVAERYEGGRMATIAIGGIEVTVGEGRAPLFRVADVAVRGLDVRRSLAAYSSTDWQPNAPIGRIRIEHANVSGFSGEILARYGVSLGSVNIDTVRESDKVSRSRTRIDGFALAPPLRNMESLKLRLALQAMGLRELKLGFDCAGTEDRARAEVTIDRCTLTVPELAEINLTGRIIGADEAFWHAVDDGDFAAFYESKAALASARLVLADRSLLERALKALAATTGQPLPATRANLARDVRRFQPAGVLINQGLEQVLDSTARFVEQGGTLTFDARPDPPLAIDRIDYLTSPGADLVSALGLSATLAR